MLKLLDDAEPADSALSNEHQIRIPRLFPCEFCHTNRSPDLLHQHQLSCSHNPANRRIPHTHTKTQRRRPPSPPPPPLPPRIPRSSPPPLPPRILQSPPISSSLPHYQSENSVVATITTIPDALQCPITSDIFEDPVLAEDGHTYERQAIIQWIRQHGTSPITREPLEEANLRPNYAIRKLVEELRSENTSL